MPMGLTTSASRRRPLASRVEALERRRLLSVAGVDFSYYQGDWSALPNFAALTPVKTGLTHNFDLSIRNQDSDYGFVWTGSLSVPTAGAYTFYTASVDGSELLIDGTRVENNDGLHANAAASGTVTLAAGPHAITVEYFDATGGQGLAVSYQGPGIAKQAIPDGVLSGSAPAAVDVASYGAVGNGTANDTAAIQAAIDAAPDGATLDLDAGKTYLLGSGLTINRPLNVEGNGATLRLDTSAYPQNETVYDASPLAATAYTWTQTVTAGQATFAAAVPTTALQPGDTVFVQLGTDPNDSTQPNWAEVCQVTANTGSAVTVNIPVPYAISQGSRTDSLQRLTDVVQDVAVRDVNFGYVSGTTPDADLWLNMARNVTVSNLTGQFTIGANVTDSQAVTVTGCSGTLNQLDSSGGRLVTAYQTDGLSITNCTATTAVDASVVFLESWTRGTTVTGLTVNWNATAASTEDVFHFTGNSYGTVVSTATINNVGAVNLVESGSQAASYSFGTVTITGPVESAPLPQIADLVTGGTSYAASTLVTRKVTVTVPANQSDDQIALCTGTVESMSFTLSSLAGVSGLFVTNGNGSGYQLIGSLVAGQADVLPQGYGTADPFNDPAYPAKTIHLYTGSAVAAGTTLTASVTYYAPPTALTGSAVYLKLDADGVHTDVWANATGTGAVAQSLVRANLPAIAFTGTAALNTVTVDFSAGDPLPSGGLTTVATSGTNAVTIVGTAGSDTVNATATTLAVAAAFGSATITDADTASLAFKGDGGADTIDVNGGTLTLAGNPTTGGGTVTLNDSAAVVFAAAPAGTGVNARALAALNLLAGGTATVATPAASADRAVLSLGTLSVAAGDTLDLGGNDMVIANGSLSAVTALAATGYDSGRWDGPGLASSAAAADPAHLTALGVIPNTAGGAAAVYPTFDGVSAAASAVLVRFTTYGDANLDGSVDLADYTRIDAGFVSAATAAPLAGWANGDFDYDGVVDGSDYTLIDSTFNAAAAAVASPAAVTAAVPAGKAVAPVVSLPPTVPGGDDARAADRFPTDAKRLAADLDPSRVNPIATAFDGATAPVPGRTARKLRAANPDRHAGDRGSLVPGLPSAIGLPPTAAPTGSVASAS